MVFPMGRKVRVNTHLVPTKDAEYYGILYCFFALLSICVLAHLLYIIPVLDHNVTGGHL